MSEQLNKLEQVVEDLRGEDGCPWDKRQTHHSLKPYLIEEAFEVIQALEDENDKAFMEELGDVLLHIVFHAKLAEERGSFTLDEVIEQLINKIVARHPHVFGEEEVEGADEVLQNWEKIKMEEKEARESIIEGVPLDMPALLLAQRIQEKASRIGFDWNNVIDVLDKLEEEIGELREAIQEGKKEEQEDELGDVLFVIANVSRFLDINAEISLRETVYKFMKRFKYMEKELRQQDNLDDASLEEMNELWVEAKNHFKKE